MVKKFEDITLEDRLLDSMASITEQELMPLIDNIEFSLVQKFDRTKISSQVINYAKDCVAIFGGIYNSLKLKMEGSRNESRQFDEFLRVYWVYVSAEGTLDFLQSKDNHTLKMYDGNNRRPSSFNLNLRSTDQTTLSDAMKQYSLFIKNSYSLEHVKNDVKSFMIFLSGYAREKIENPTMTRFKEIFEDTLILSTRFKIEGIKKGKRETEQKEEHRDVYKKGLEEVVVDPVKKEDIVGNLAAIECLETEVPCLIIYDPVEKRNPFNGFEQYILLVGKSGTGKTMTARYGMSIAKQIAEKARLPLTITRLDFEDRFQCGPIDNIRNQLREVSNGNQAYIVFIDEIDTKLGSRNTTASEGYKNEVVGEFLRFRGGGDYINKGNYIILATTNRPKQIDPAILRVFSIYELDGPVTPEEKAKVLYNNLVEGIKIGYVDVKDWKKIGEFLYQYKLEGGNIYNVAQNAKSKHRKIASQIPFGLTASQTERKTTQYLAQGNGQYVTKDQDIIQSILFEAEKIKKEDETYLVR